MKKKNDTIWLGNYFNFTGKSYDGWVIDTKGLSYTLLACMEHGNVPKIIEENNDKALTNKK